MKRLAALFIPVLIIGSVALSQEKPSASERAALLLAQEIPLPNVGGRIDHFTFDAKRKRVIGAALGNNTVEIGHVFRPRYSQHPRCSGTTRSGLRRGYRQAVRSKRHRRKAQNLRWRVIQAAELLAL
jgi:hypothetical protein